MGDVTVHRFPWEPVERSTEDKVTALQRDFAYVVVMTAVRVHSSRPELEITVNTKRGQIIPRNEGKFRDGTTLEFQDLGMPQPSVQTMTVPELLEYVLTTAAELGLQP